MVLQRRRDTMNPWSMFSVHRSIPVLFLLIVSSWAEHFLYKVKYVSDGLNFPKDSRFISQLASCGEVDATIVDLLRGEEMTTFLDLSPEEGALTLQIATLESIQFVLAANMVEGESNTFFQMNYPLVSAGSKVGFVVFRRLEPFSTDVLNEYVQRMAAVKSNFPNGCPDTVFFHYLSADHHSDVWLFLQNYEWLLLHCRSRVVFDSDRPQMQHVISHLLHSMGYTIQYQPLCSSCPLPHLKLSHRVLLVAKFQENLSSAVRVNVSSSNVEHPFIYFMQQQERLESAVSGLEKALTKLSVSHVQPVQCARATGLVPNTIGIRIPLDNLLPTNSMLLTVLLPLLHDVSLSLRLFSPPDISALDLNVNAVETEALLTQTDLLSYGYLYCVSWSHQLQQTMNYLSLHFEWLSDAMAAQYSTQFTTKEALFHAIRRELSIPFIQSCASAVQVSMAHHKMYAEFKYVNVNEQRRSWLSSLQSVAVNSLEYQRMAQIPIESLMVGPNMFPSLVNTYGVYRPYSFYFGTVADHHLPISINWSQRHQVQRKEAKPTETGSLTPDWSNTADTFIDALYQWQHPPVQARHSHERSCQTAKFLVYEPLSSHFGPAAIIEQVQAAMQYALCLDRIFIMQPNDVEGSLARYRPDDCQANNPFVCYFEALSSCTLTDEEWEQASLTASSTGHHWEELPWNETRVLMLKGLPVGGACAKLPFARHLSSTTIGEPYQQHSSPSTTSFYERWTTTPNVKAADTCDAAADPHCQAAYEETEWTQSVLTDLRYPKRREVATSSSSSSSPWKGLLADERRQHLSLVLPYILRPKPWFQLALNRVVSTYLMSPTPSWQAPSDPVALEKAFDQIRTKTDAIPFIHLSSSSFSSSSSPSTTATTSTTGGQLQPDNYIVIHLRYPHYDIIAPATMNEFELQHQPAHRRNASQATPATTANSFEVYEQTTYQAVMTTVATHFPQIVDIYVILESNMLLGQLCREYPQYRFHVLFNMHVQDLDSSFTVHDRHGFNQFTTSTKAQATPHVKYQHQLVWWLLLAQWSVLAHAQGGVGMTSSHGSSLLAQWFQWHHGGHRPFYLVGEDDTFGGIDPGYWFSPRLLYGRQPMKHGRAFIRQRYQRAIAQSVDLYQHLPTLRQYAAQSTVRVILECGVRDTLSSWAFSQGLMDQQQQQHQGQQRQRQPPLYRYHAMDLTRSPYIALLEHHLPLAGVEYRFQQGSDLESPIPETVDLLFIDTLHVYGQLQRELYRFARYVRQYIILHDTTVDGDAGEVRRLGFDVAYMQNITQMSVHELTTGLWPAVEEFLRGVTAADRAAGGPHWRLVHRYTNNNGLTILQRVDASDVIELAPSPAVSS